MAVPSTCSQQFERGTGGDEVGFTQKVKLLQCINGVEIVLYEASATRERP